MSINGTQATPDHWYRHRWPWVLMTVPFAAVLFGILMFSTALLYPDDVVVDTYYKDGQGINQLRALDEMAVALDIQASLMLNDDSQSATILLTGSEEPYLTLELFHVSDSAQDISLMFTASTNERFVANESTLQSIFAQRGVWYVELRGADNDWRLRRRIETPLDRLDF